MKDSERIFTIRLKDAEIHFRVGFKEKDAVVHGLLYPTDEHTFAEFAESFTNANKIINQNQ